MYDYSLQTGDRSIKASEIIARLDASIPLQFAHIQEVKQLCEKGCRYSYQDFDVLSAAYRAIGKTEVDQWNKGWVEYWAKKAA